MAIIALICSCVSIIGGVITIFTVVADNATKKAEMDIKIQTLEIRAAEDRRSTKGEIDEILKRINAHERVLENLSVSTKNVEKIVDRIERKLDSLSQLK